MRALDCGLLEVVSPEGHYIADDPVVLLGLIKLVELRGCSWQAVVGQIKAVMERFGCGA